MDPRPRKRNRKNKTLKNPFLTSCVLMLSFFFAVSTGCDQSLAEVEITELLVIEDIVLDTTQTVGDTAIFNNDSLEDQSNPTYVSHSIYVELTERPWNDPSTAISTSGFVMIGDSIDGQIRRYRISGIAKLVFTSADDTISLEVTKPGYTSYERKIAVKDLEYWSHSSPMIVVMEHKEPFIPKTYMVGMDLEEGEMKILDLDYYGYISEIVTYNYSAYGDHLRYNLNFNEVHFLATHPNYPAEREMILVNINSLSGSKTEIKIPDLTGNTSPRSNELDSKYYGLNWSDALLKVISITPSGQYDTVKVFNEYYGTMDNWSAYDQNNDRYWFVGVSNVMDLSLVGLSVKDTTDLITIDPNGFLMNTLRYHNEYGVFYGLTYNSASNLLSFGTLDQYGVKTIIRSYDLGEGEGSWSQLDQENDHFYISWRRHASGDAWESEVIILDLADGAMIHSFDIRGDKLSPQNIGFRRTRYLK